MIARRSGKDISHEPEMRELKEVFRAMADGEKTRTMNHLKDDGDEHG